MFGMAWCVLRTRPNAKLGNLPARGSLRLDHDLSYILGEVDVNKKVTGNLEAGDRKPISRPGGSHS
jgi:hypothetical protein